MIDRIKYISLTIKVLNKVYITIEEEDDKISITQVTFPHMNMQEDENEKSSPVGKKNTSFF